MAGETACTMKKWPDEKKFLYWHQGITRGNCSYKASVLNYLSRAELLAGEVDQDDTSAGLHLTQSLGRATHRLIALAAVSETHSSKSKITLVRTLICEEVGEYVNENVPTSQSAVAERKTQVNQAFTSLQRSQDLGELSSFRAIIMEETIATGSLFVSAAANYGYPRPDLSSGSLQRDALLVI